MNEFENRSFYGIEASRFVASWINAGGNFERGNKFREWLRALTIKGHVLNDEEIRFIYNYAVSGKLELQEAAKEFLKGA